MLIPKGLSANEEAACAVFQVFAVTRPGMELQPSYTMQAFNPFDMNAVNKRLTSSRLFYIYDSTLMSRGRYLDNEKLFAYRAVSRSFLSM